MSKFATLSNMLAYLLQCYFGLEKFVILFVFRYEISKTVSGKFGCHN
jgi:hypothetical protein